MKSVDYPSWIVPITAIAAIVATVLMVVIATSMQRPVQVHQQGAALETIGGRASYDEYGNYIYNKYEERLVFGDDDGLGGRGGGSAGTSYDLPYIPGTFPPSVELSTSPYSDAFTYVGYGSRVTAKATVGYTKPGVKQVEFYVNGKLVATDTAAPYEYTYKPDLKNGGHISSQYVPGMDTRPHTILRDQITAIVTTNADERSTDSADVYVDFLWQ